MNTPRFSTRVCRCADLDEACDGDGNCSDPLSVCGKWREVTSVRFLDENDRSAPRNRRTPEQRIALAATASEDEFNEHACDYSLAEFEAYLMASPTAERVAAVRDAMGPLAVKLLASVGRAA